ncbi:TPA: DNA-protecting protein DprA [Streptococcus pneumoniae]|uniref:DNA-processing protein DprA n=1 Tax=Streptococcus pneumoniae TaxID=1313 RepID=UPI0005E8773A|nr:DNA-processing protein DprA [Streptococcus pneumoniae]CEY83777.1 DNA processing protein DprA [Streptococcus pneumoniae]CEY98842.1 DNA processing protein DprA [Streptococcus pneumoniae]CJM59644.1 DNA processing protein DprA [Streptococcus pneumoniae]CJM69709.1 DNA processing protein DprA [Streptococcus pneumoniae]CJM79041.1 DNA processing protein DprA [Streptococcus pneumoniae]
MKITNYEIYKLKKSGLTNQQILKVLEYGENVDQELLLGDIADISGCRNPAVFMERYFQIDDAHLSKEFQKFPSFSILDDCYPWDLSEIYDAPVLLFYKGNLDLLKFPKVAVVGSRACSKQGAKSVEKVIQGLENELVIVSGLAKGIDTAALQNGGKTIAVIGTGLDVFYPKANKRLQDYIGNDHLVLSEYGPGEQPLKFHFPARNRIIAGLCRGVIVAEAKMRSGSLITCERAMEEGRDVFAIPGSILDGLSDGCHHLIQEGAKLLTSGQDVLAEFEF